MSILLRSITYHNPFFLYWWWIDGVVFILKPTSFLKRRTILMLQRWFHTLYEYEWYHTGLHFPEIVQGDPLIVCLVFARSHLPASDTSDASFPFSLPPPSFIFFDSQRRLGLGLWSYTSTEYCFVQGSTPYYSVPWIESRYPWNRRYKQKD